MNSLSQETGDTEPMVKGSSETSCDTIHEATSAALEFQVTMCSITSKLQAKPLTGLAPSLLPGSCRRKDSENHSLESASHRALDHWFDQTEIKADGSQTGLVRYPETSSPQTLSLSLSLSLACLMIHSVVQRQIDCVVCFFTCFQDFSLSSLLSSSCAAMII